MALNQQGLWHFVPDHFWSRSFFGHADDDNSPKCCWQGGFKCHTIWNASKASAKHIVATYKIVTHLKISHKSKITQCLTDDSRTTDTQKYVLMDVVCDSVYGIVQYWKENMTHTGSSASWVEHQSPLSHCVVIACRQFELWQFLKGKLCRKGWP